MSQQIRKRKEKLLRDYDMFNQKAESQNLPTEEIEEMNNNMDELNRLWDMDETKARQRSRDRNITGGNRDTRYFQTIANQRRRSLIIPLVS